MSSTFETRPTGKSGGGQAKPLIVQVPGNLTSTSIEALRQKVNFLLDCPADQALPWQTLQLDLSAARMVDSAGLNLIVAIFKAVKHQGRRMQILYSDNNVHRYAALYPARSAC
ncbi:MAG: STAS domain-containing protein [Verrucomicrobiota bacterium]